MLTNLLIYLKGNQEVKKSNREPDNLSSSRLKPEFCLSFEIRCLNPPIFMYDN